MFQTIFLAPVLFIESLMGCFILPKISKINPVYINAFSGSILSGVAVVSILPNIQSYYGRVSLLSSMFIMFCFQYLIKYRNTRKSVALLTNSLGLGFYSLLSGLSLSYVDGHDFIQFATLLVFSSLAISYSLGHNVSFSEYGEVMASLTGVAGDPVVGKKVSINRKLGNCLACHVNDDASSQSFHGEVGPALNGAGSRWSEEELRGIVVNSKHTFEGTIMPAFYSTENGVRTLKKFEAHASERQ